GLASRNRPQSCDGLSSLHSNNLPPPSADRAFVGRSFAGYQYPRRRLCIGKYCAAPLCCESSPLFRVAEQESKLWVERRELAGPCGFAVSTNMPVVLQDACDENIIRSGLAAAPCSKTRGRWILAATILASSMAFIDGTVVNVALPALQTNLNATAADV